MNTLRLLLVVWVLTGVPAAQTLVSPRGQQPARQPDIHFTPTRHAVADAMLRLARVSENDVVYDLGSGDGRIPIIAAQKYGARGIGLELDAGLIALARQNARDAGVSERVAFIEGDLFEADLTTATVVTLYLSAEINRRLESKLRRELNPGARVVSHQFRLGTWAPDNEERLDAATIFLWRVPER
ncbi:MAG: SAM-dependent methyltransferase [Acidobacteriota bacterium]